MAGGNLGLTMCPGKSLAAGRDGKSYQRDIAKDVVHFKAMGASLIVCLLNDYELRTIGVDVKKYLKACESSGIRLLKYPILEMAAPTDMASLHSEVILPICAEIDLGNKVITHCRGGVGRAGLVASCVLAVRFKFKSHKEVIAYVRERRDKRCVESRK